MSPVCTLTPRRSQPTCKRGHTSPSGLPSPPSSLSTPYRLQRTQACGHIVHARTHTHTHIPPSLLRICHGRIGATVSTAQLPAACPPSTGHGQSDVFWGTEMVTLRRRGRKGRPQWTPFHVQTAGIHNVCIGKKEEKQTSHRGVNTTESCDTQTLSRHADVCCLLMNTRNRE